MNNLYVKAISYSVIHDTFRMMPLPSNGQVIPNLSEVFHVKSVVYKIICLAVEFGVIHLTFLLDAKTFALMYTENQ